MGENVPQICWNADISQGQQAYFIALLRGLIADIDPGESLKEIRIVADDAFVSVVQALLAPMNKAYQPGPHLTTCATIPVEMDKTFFTVIVIRQAFFTPSDIAPQEQTSGLAGALSHCKLYHVAWQRRGFVYRENADPYTTDLFAMCGQIHDAYAVSRVKNVLISQRLDLRIDGTGQIIPFFIQFGGSVATLFDQVPNQIWEQGIFQLDPSQRKHALFFIAYRFIFEPLARYAGFLAPIPPDYPLRAVGNDPEHSPFYREIIASYWIPMKSALEASFDSQFNETEKALQTISELVDACLETLLKGLNSYA